MTDTSNKNFKVFSYYLGIRMGAEAVLATLDENQEPCVITIHGLATKRLPLVPLVEKTQSVAKATAAKDWDTVKELRGQSFISKMRVYELLNSYGPEPKSDELKGINFMVLHVGSLTRGLNTSMRCLASDCISRSGTIYGVYDGIDGIIADNIKQITWSDIAKSTHAGAELGKSNINI